jgi:hypothetical protein
MNVTDLGSRPTVAFVLNLQALLPVSRVVSALSCIATQHAVLQYVLHCFSLNASSYISSCMYCGPYFSLPSFFSPSHFYFGMHDGTSVCTSVCSSLLFFSEKVCVSLML